jgi:hypothetical protein
MSSEFNFGRFIPVDDMPLCDTTDHSFSLPTIGMQFSNKTIVRTCAVIDHSVTINSDEKIYDSIFIMAQQKRYLIRPRPSRWAIFPLFTPVSNSASQQFSVSAHRWWYQLISLRATIPIRVSQLIECVP